MARVMVIFLCAFFLVPVFLPAQTAAELEDILKTRAVTCLQAARFVVGAADGEAGADAFEQAVSRGWFKNASPNQYITMGNLSFLLMRAFDIKGGMMYAIFPGPRYAFRTMVSRSFIQSPADPGLTVSGDRFLQILGNVLNAEGGEE